MSSSWLCVVVSFILPALAVMLVFSAAAGWCRLNPRGWKWFLPLALVSLGFVLAPVDGLPLARWLTGVVDHWSIPLIALLVSAVWRRWSAIEFLRPADCRQAWVFGAIAGAVLYPSALGLGAVDVFASGWQCGVLFVSMALLTAVLIWRGSRFGLVLVLAIAAWHVGLPESRNYWDCLVDPIYAVFSVGMLAFGMIRAILRAHPANNRPQPCP